MAEQGFKRKLTAILSADVEGYMLTPRINDPEYPAIVKPAIPQDIYPA